MGILNRYLCKEFLKLLLLFEFALFFVYFIVDFINKFGDFIEVDAPMDQAFAFFLYKIPFICVQVVPAAALLSVIVMFCSMEKNNEITAMKSSGMSVLQLSKPIIFVTLLLAVGAFLVSELVVPYASARSNHIWDVVVKKKDRTRFYGRNRIWYKGKNSIYHIRRFDSEKKILWRVTLYFMDDSFQLVKRLDAVKGVWTGDKWKFYQGIVQHANEKGEYDLKKFNEMEVKLPEGPQAFVRTVKEPEEMSYWELKRYAKRIRHEGYDPTRYLVDMNIKLAFPLITFVMVILGIPIALGIKKGGTPLAVSVGIAVCFLYLLTLGFSRSLGLRGVLPPLFSAWLANAVFLLISSYLMMRVKT